MRGFARDDSRCLADLTDEEFRQVITELRAASDEVAYAAFGADTPGCVAICFCGWQERFATLAMFRGLNVPLLIAQDPFAPWFTGSPLCAGLDEIADVARARFPRAQRFLLGGQSSGGYAALALSRRLTPSLTIAISPQSFDDAAIKSRLRLPPDFVLSATPAIHDLRAMFQAAGQGEANPAWIIAAHAESANPPQGYFWIDALHWSRLADLDGVRVMVLRHDYHHVLQHSSRGFAACLRRLAALSDWSDAAVEPVLQALHCLRLHPQEQPAGREGHQRLQAIVALIPVAAAMDQTGLRRILDLLLAGHEDHATLLHTAGVALGAGGLAAEARAMFERALAIAPEMHFSSTELAHLSFQAGDLTAAQSWLARSLTTAPSDRRAVMMACHHALQSGNRAAARAILHTAQTHDPEADWITAELASLSAD